MRVVDLFSGCGGLSLGFEKAGFEVVAACEWWDAAITCYKENFTHPVLKVDLSDVDSAVEVVKGFSPDMIIQRPTTILNRFEMMLGRNKIMAPIIMNISAIVSR